MPAFFKVLECLSSKGNIIKIIILTDEKKLLHKKNFIKLKNVKIECLNWPKNKSFKSIYLFLINYIKIIKTIINFKPNFVYCLGSVGAIGLLAARLTNIPCASRIFGTNFYSKKYIRKNRLTFFLNHPLLFLCFYTKSNFILITNDGSPGNLLYKKIGNKKTPLYFWKNGYEVSRLKKNILRKNTNQYLYYPSRISGKKQQIMAIQFLKKLREKTNLEIDLILSGHISDYKYYSLLMDYTKKVNLNSCVKYVGVLNKEDVYFKMKKSLAVLSFQKVSNLSNTLLEALYNKSLVVTFKEKSLNKFLENSRSAILIKNIDEGVDKISKIVKDKDKMNLIKKTGKKKLEEHFLKWNVRVKHEIKLINDSRN